MTLLDPQEQAREQRKASRKARYAANREKYLAQTKAYKAAHPEKVRAQKRAYYIAHPEKRKTHSTPRDAVAREKIRAASKAYYTTHREAILAKKRARYAADPLRRRPYQRAWYRASSEARPDAFQARRRAWYRVHREAVRQQQRVYQDAHKDKLRPRRKAYYIAHHDEICTRRRLAHKANPALNRNRCQRHRAAKRSAPRNDLTHTQWLEIQAAQNYRCYYCGKLRKGKLTQDHILPLSKGGSHTLHNVIAACQPCNSEKGTNAPKIPVQPMLLTVTPAKPFKRRKASGVASEEDAGDAA